MWILSKDGFISAVAYDPSKDRDKTSPFPAIAKQKGTHILVRARRQEHLEPIKSVVPKLVIVDDRGADYRFRCVIKREQFGTYLLQLIDQIDYWSHFKEAMRAAQPAHLKEAMYSAAMKTWGTFASLQASAPYKGFDRKPSTKTPAHTSVADYQRDKGVKPFKSSQQVLFEKPEASPADDEWIENLDQLLSEGARGRLTLKEVATLITSRKGSVTFTSDELQKMDDQGFELVVRLQEKYGTSANVSPTLVSKVSDDIMAGKGA